MIAKRIFDNFVPEKLLIPEEMGAPAEHQVASTPADNLIEISGRACFDENVEVYTKSGWMKIKDANSSQEVLTFNNRDNIFEWQIPINKSERQYTGKMYEVDSRGVKIRTTLDHRWYVSYYHDDDYEIKLASELIDRRFKIRKSAILPGFKTTYDLPPHKYTQRIKNRFGSCGQSKERTIPGYTIPQEKMISFCHLLGWYFSEGCAGKTGRSAPKLTIYQNDRYVWQILQAIEDLGYKFGITTDKRNGVHQIRVYNSILARYLMQFGKNSYDKHLPKEVFELTPEYRLAIAESLVLGDGTQLESGNWVYQTASKELADDVQMLFTSIGIACSLNPHYDRENDFLSYSVRMLAKDEQAININHVICTDTQNEKVYCINVPNSLLLVRSRDQILIIGNCYDSLGRKNSRNSEEYHKHIYEVKHLSVCEHFHMPLRITTSDPDIYLDIIKSLSFRPGVHITGFTEPDFSILDYVDNYAVDFVINIRAVLEWDDFKIPGVGQDRVGENLKYDIQKRAKQECPLACAHLLQDVNEEWFTHNWWELEWYQALPCGPADSSWDNSRYISYFITDVSRNLSHEWVRHKWCTAVSQRSTRYVDEGNSPIIQHPAVALDLTILQDLHVEDYHERGRTIYKALTDRVQAALVKLGCDKLTSRKQARAAAIRNVSHGLRTEFVFTASLAQWKRIIQQRANEHADAEIRLLADAIYHDLSDAHLIECAKYERPCQDTMGYHIDVL